MVSDDFYARVQECKDLQQQAEERCRQRRELSLAEIARMALAQDLRPWGIFTYLEEEGFTIDFNQGKVYPPSRTDAGT
jgi:hypothetical protein